jgi:hypothetical protein
MRDAWLIGLFASLRLRDFALKSYFIASGRSANPAVVPAILFVLAT